MPGLHYVQIFFYVSLMARAIGALAGDICSWSQFRAAVVRDALYIDGGELYIYGALGLPVTDFGNGSMYLLNFSTKFDTSKDNLTSLFLSTPKSASLPEGGSYYEGCMFADDFELFIYGGLPTVAEVEPYPRSDFVFGDKIYEKDPTVTEPELGPYEPSLQGVTRFISNGAVANVPSESLGFYFSGMHGVGWGSTDPGMPPPNITADSLIQVSMENFGVPVFSNNTFTNSNDAVFPRANAELVWIPVSSQGILIAIGGVIYPESLFSEDLTPEQITASENISPSFMKSVSIYDISNNAWYVQETTGNSYPGQLTEFCSVVTSEKGPGSSSFDIYIYGGYNGLAGVGYKPPPPSDDVWVLSVPSFTWTKVYPGNSTHGRYGHFCTAPYPDQMWVVGGNGNPSSSSDGCLPAPVIEVFNLNTLNWQDQYDPSKWSPYKTPPPVASAIKANPTPTSFNPSLASLFNAQYTKNIRTWYPYLPSPSPKLSKWQKPVIAVVVSVIGVSAIIFTFIFCRRRKRKSGSSKIISEVQPFGAVANWRNGIPKTDPSVTTTEVDGESADPFGGYYEVDGDFKFRNQNASPPQPGFAEVSAGTRRISSPTKLPPRSPRSPQQSGSVEVGGEERYEMQGMGPRDSQSSDIPTTYHFRDHPLYPRSVDDNLDRAVSQSQSSKQLSSYGGARSSGSHGRPSPYVVPHPTDDTDIASQGASEQTSPELPASPVERRPSAARNISSLSSGIPVVSPYSEHEDAEIDQLERHSGLGFDTSPGMSRRMRPRHTRNVSSISSGLTQLPSPAEEGEPSPGLEHRTALAAHGFPDNITSTQEITEMKPLMEDGEASRQKVDYPPNARMSVARKPVNRAARTSAFSEAESLEDGK